jgi:hypothetical protein
MSFLPTNPNFVTVFQTPRETIQVLVLPEFSKDGLRQSQLEHYGELMIKARTKLAQQHAEEQFNQLNPLNRN